MIPLLLAFALAAPPAPPAPPEVGPADLERFGLTRVQVYAEVRWLAEARQAALTLASLDPVGRAFWSRLAEDLDWRHRTWDTLDWALIYRDDLTSAEGEPDEHRAELLACWLGVLRDRIGCAAYYSGRMPPPVPYWLFAPLD